MNMLAKGLLLIFIGYLLSDFVYFLPGFVGSALAFVGMLRLRRHHASENGKYALTALGVLVAGNILFALYHSRAQAAADSLPYIVSVFVLNVIHLWASVSVLSVGLEIYDEYGLKKERSKLEKNQRIYLLGMGASLAIHLVCNLLGLAKGILLAGITVAFLYLWFLVMILGLYRKAKTPAPGQREPAPAESPELSAPASAECREEAEKYAQAPRQYDQGTGNQDDEMENEGFAAGETAEEAPVLTEEAPPKQQERRGQPLD